MSEKEGTVTREDSNVCPTSDLNLLFSKEFMKTEDLGIKYPTVYCLVWKRRFDRES